MGQVKIILPAMGEGIFEATITQWLVQVGDQVQEDDSLVEIATDKVDSEVPSPADGKIIDLLIPDGETAKIGDVIAVIEVENQAENIVDKDAVEHDEQQEQTHDTNLNTDKNIETGNVYPRIPFRLKNGVFLSPLVRSIAQSENVSVDELELISGSGLNGRIIKDDIINYISNNKSTKLNNNSTKQSIELIEMSRMRKLIADNMVNSKRISPHVTSFHEVDVTDIVKWREKNKKTYELKFGEKLTYTPIFIDAVVRAIKKYPLINISVDGVQILKKERINIGMATALPDGNLIVPVIHNAGNLRSSQITQKVNDLASRARSKKLQPHEIQGGTFTITNIGSFGNLSGTPIINQPESAILAIGTIKKRPAVIETAEGDFIGIRHQLILSLSYDHRVIDGSLGGLFLKQIADNLESFDATYWL